ncbi:hypothetical protein KAV79_04710 [Candidatus Aerophobetes bacterium]|nr:hypothetical protein [Candidatus Aerophobetes bacterium]
MSSPNEIKILRIVRELEGPTKKVVAEEMEISEDYAGYLLRELANRGFLEKVSGSYYIIEKGVDELLGTLYHIQGILQAKIYRAARQQRRIEGRINQLKGSKVKLPTK